MDENFVCDYKKGRGVRILDWIIISVIILISIYAIIKYNYFQEELSHGVERYGVLGVFVFSFILESIPQFIHPFSSVIFASGIGINVFIATFFSLIGSFVGAVVAFEIGKRYGFRLVCPLFSEKTLVRTLKSLDKYGNVFILISAVSPFPYLPLIFGSLGIRRKYFWLYGILVRAISFIFLGFLLQIGVNIL